MLVSSSLPVRRLLALAAVGSVSACKGSESVVVPPPVDAAYRWGWGPYGHLGSPPTETCPTSTGSEPCTSMPLAVLGGLRFISVSAGARHTCAVAADSTAYCWGGNDAGQLGNGSGSNAEQPVAVMGSIKFAAVTVGFSHSCGWTGTGDAYCWGDNTWGQIGAPRRAASPVPVPVTGG